MLSTSAATQTLGRFSFYIKFPRSPANFSSTGNTFGSVVSHVGSSFFSLICQHTNLSYGRRNCLIERVRCVIHQFSNMLCSKKLGEIYGEVYMLSLVSSRFFIAFKIRINNNFKRLFIPYLNTNHVYYLSK